MEQERQPRPWLLHPYPSVLMKIGITCYPTYGGSGAVATELGLELARRGHEVHELDRPDGIAPPRPAGRQWDAAAGAATKSPG